MTPLHAAIVGAAIVVVGAAITVAVALRTAGQDDDRQGRPRG